MGGHSPRFDGDRVTSGRVGSGQSDSVPAACSGLELLDRLNTRALQSRNPMLRASSLARQVLLPPRKAHQPSRNQKNIWLMNQVLTTPPSTPPNFSILVLVCSHPRYPQLTSCWHLEMEGNGCFQSFLPPCDVAMVLWRVVGGTSSGLVVREQLLLTSAAKEQRLQHGAVVEEALGTGGSRCSGMSVCVKRR